MGKSGYFSTNIESSLGWMGFIRLRRNTLQRTVAQAMARRRLATGMNGKANRAEARQSAGGFGYGAISL